jgi:hypothetical protein
MTTQDNNENLTPEASAPSTQNESAAPATPVVPAAPETVPTVEQKHPIFVELPKEKWRDAAVTMDVPNQTAEETNELLKQMPSIDYGASAEGRAFIQHLQDANFSIPHRDWLQDVPTRPGSKWTQEVTSEIGPLRAQLPRLTVGGSGTMTGDSANMKLRAAMGMGSLFKFPCWHTGLWLTVKAPTEVEQLELNRRLTEEKIRLGRQTHGLAFSNNSVFFAGHLTDFAIGHIQNSTLIETDKTWHEILDIRDLHALVWAMAYTIWPSGYQYSRAKIDPANGAWRREESLLKLGALQWVDTASLTEKQVKHMAKSIGKVHNLETLKMYQEEFLRGQPRKIDLNERVSIELAVPTLAKYLASGQTWVNNIVTMVDRAFSLPPGDQQRLDFIMTNGRATNMRQFSHWVSAIVIEGERITEIEDIERNLDDLSGLDEVVDKYFEGIRQYEEDSLVSIIGVPRTNYEKDSNVMERFPNLLVLDPLSTFFILLYQKVSLLSARI